MCVEVILEFLKFPAELIIAEAAFLIDRERKERFALRAPAALAVYFILSVGWSILIEAIAVDSFFPYVLLYLGYAALSLLPVWFCFELEPLECVFVIAGGYATEHMVFALDRIILFSVYGTLVTEGIQDFFYSYITYVIGAGIVYFLIVRRNRDKDAFRRGDVRIAALAMILGVAAVALSVSYSYPKTEENIYNCLICPAYGFICCALILLMEYYVLRENHMKQEQEMMEQLLDMANAQQRSSKEAIDIINIKCHDLKHQIKAFARMDDAGMRSDYVREVQEAVSIYDATYHTGCEALDYVLREKSLFCTEHDVSFTCMADGTQLKFMDTTDVYALIGNAMDNAIERVVKEKEEERTVSLQIRQRGEMVLIHLVNRCSREVPFQENLPVTDKEDKRYHGFGMKSMRYIAEKYGGEMYAKAENGWFYLDFLFPRV
ncbi:uncharacterized protein BN499_02721 [Blautia hydrogenotrophica CAG:147]|uniref:ATP-binding protein n=1 Tax=Blautia hydrogenotrophica TaxID=53443 RepID=UPI000340B383|nr:ATP-binding protein [Blautia hydrogenotrophica]CCX59444.1 uncharacterized protein BN499_02721 [Blautia hydrogenotrophica CAG:147]